ncbi:hypothetical protein L195_g061550 [Trifolium pratense]|uniref:Uncharacterized protein n=1 Tax=Trifolium pratense TaxID=57577 RepID=A0A2K3KAI3_TRIPR|nr:hypothetical protein L195_g061550 [Trifolium pratense]
MQLKVNKENLSEDRGGQGSGTSYGRKENGGGGGFSRVITARQI